jgi:hypothetical protein
MVCSLYNNTFKCFFLITYFIASICVTPRPILFVCFCKTSHLERRQIAQAHLTIKCVCVRLYVSAFLNVSPLNLEGTFYGSWQVEWAIYVCVFPTCVRVHAKRAHVCVNLCFGRIISNLAVNTTNHRKLYVLCTFRAQAPRTCVRVVKSSHIFGRASVRVIFGWIISKCCKNILRATTNCMGYVMFMFTHCARMWERACASERVVRRSHICGRILPKFGKNILHVTTIYMGLLTTCIAHACASERVCMFAHLWTDSLHIWWELTIVTWVI